MRVKRGLLVPVVALAVAGAAACATTQGTQVLVQTDLAAADLERYGDLTVYDLLRRHTRVFFSNRQAGREVMYTYGYGGSASLTQGGTRPAVLRVNHQEVVSPVEELRSIYVDQVERIEILKATEYSARYGGPGRRGGVLITLKGGVQ